MVPGGVRNRSAGRRVHAARQLGFASHGPMHLYLYLYLYLLYGGLRGQLGGQRVLRQRCLRHREPARDPLH